MPTDRFLNLPKEKQNRILEAAFKEYSRVPFRDVSINQIVQNAGIARGSFYQYFEGKKDLMEYLMLDYRESVRSGVEQRLQEKNADIFNAFYEVLEAVIEYGTREGNFDFFRNTCTYNTFDEDGLLHFLEQSESQIPEMLLELISVENLKIHKSEDIRDLMEMLTSLLSFSVAKVFFNVREKEYILKSFRNKLNMLKYGLLKDVEMESERNA